QQPRGARGDVRIRVDLPVRVPEGDADRLAAVLERKDLLDPGQSGQCRRAIRPRLDDGARAGHGLGAERARGVRAEAYDLAAPDRCARPAEAEVLEVLDAPRGIDGRRRGAGRLGECGSEGGRTVLEDRDVVARGDL